MYNEIRKFILAGEIEKAFQLLQEVVKLDVKNDVFLLYFQYNEWKKYNYNPSYTDKNERNRIVYAMLAIVTQEDTETQPKNQATLKSMYSCELEIGKRYETIVTLEKDTMIDLFLFWLQQEYPALYEQMGNLAKKKDVYIDFQKIISYIDLSGFIQANHFAIAKTVKKDDFVLPLDYLSNFLVNKLSEKNFLSDWLKYQEQKAQDIQIQIDAIKKLLQRHSTLLIGITGGILGGLAYQFFQNLTENLNLDEDDDVDLDGD